MGDQAAFRSGLDDFDPGQFFILFFSVLFNKLGQTISSFGPLDFGPFIKF
jgi:hypothetical protein